MYQELTFASNYFTMRLRILFVLVMMGFSVVFAENNEKNNKKNSEVAVSTTISGTITDLNTGEAIPGAQVIIRGTQLKVYTDFDGNFNIENVVSGTYNLEVSYISYDDVLVKEINTCKENELDIKLENIN